MDSTNGEVGDKEIKMDSTNGEVGSTVSAKTKRERRTWPAQLSVRLCREVVFLRPYQFVPRSEERTSTWELIIDNLRSLSEYKEMTFETKAVKEHLTGILAKRKAQVRKDDKETGLGEEKQRTELQVLLDELIEDMEREEEIHRLKTNEKKNADDKEKEQALEVRKRAMESLGQTRKRNGDPDESSPSAKGTNRRSGSETLTYLREKTEALQKSNEERAKIKQAEMDLRKKEFDAMNANYKTMAENLQASQQQMMISFAQQQQMMQQQQTQMQQQMQQSMIEGMKQMAQIFANKDKN